MNPKARCWLLVLHRFAMREEKWRLEWGRLSIIALMSSCGSKSIAFIGIWRGCNAVCTKNNMEREFTAKSSDTDNSRKMRVDSGWTRGTG